MDSFRSALAVN